MRRGAERKLGGTGATCCAVHVQLLAAFFKSSLRGKLAILAMAVEL